MAFSGPVAAIVLAAGASTRLGEPKQLLRFQCESLLRRIARAAHVAGCRPVIVVTGAKAERMSEELDGLDVQEVRNPLWETGMASSIRAGVSALLTVEPAIEAAVLLLCDQPDVTDAQIAGLVANFRSTGSSIVASQYANTCGVPALVRRELFCELLELTGEGGAKQVIQRHLSDALLLPFDGGEVDIDTPEDVERLWGNQAS